MTAVVLVGARLQELRTARGLSQRALADRTGLPQSDISAMEQGQKLPSFCTVLGLAAAVDCRVTDLVSVFDGHDLHKPLR